MRGNGGQRIFFSDQDRCRLLLLLQEGIHRFGHRIHGFCLMDNHLHLAIQVAEVPLAKIMQNLAFCYTRWINLRQRRIGHLFQGRYKAILVDRDAYLLELVRYIHLNPVRAGLVAEPRRYAWSGHRAYLGDEVLPWLTTDWILGQFSAKGHTRRPAEARAVIGWLATEQAVATLTEVARRFGREVGALSEAVRRLSEWLATMDRARRVQARLHESNLLPKPSVAILSTH